MSIIEEIYDVLQENDIDTYFPEQHQLECTKEYVVIKNSGVVGNVQVSSERTMYKIMCYVPTNQYSRLEPFVYQVKQTLKKLYPTIMYQKDSETPSFYDDDLKGHMVSFTMLGCRKIERW